MRAQFVIPVIVSILILGTLGYQEAFAGLTIITDEPSCENAPVLGDFQSGTCTLDGTHTIPSPDLWAIKIPTIVTGTVNVNGVIELRSTTLTNECNGIINLIGGGDFGSLFISAQFNIPPPTFNNFGTINGINSNLPTQVATVVLNGLPGKIVVFNNHGTLTAPVFVGPYSIFNDNLQDQCVPVGGTYIPIDQSALLLAGVQSISMWMIPVVIAGIGIGVFVIKRRN